MELTRSGFIVGIALGVGMILVGVYVIDGLEETEHYEGIITDKWESIIRGTTTYRFEINELTLIMVDEYDFHNYDINDIYAYDSTMIIGEW